METFEQAKDWTKPRYGWLLLRGESSSRTFTCPTQLNDLCDFSLHSPIPGHCNCRHCHSSITYKEKRTKNEPFHNCHFDLPVSALHGSVQTSALSQLVCTYSRCSSVRLPSSLILICRQGSLVAAVAPEVALVTVLTLFFLFWNTGQTIKVWGFTSISSLVYTRIHCTLPLLS